MGLAFRGAGRGQGGDVRGGGGGFGLQADEVVDDRVKVGRGGRRLSAAIGRRSARDFGDDLVIRGAALPPDAQPHRQAIVRPLLRHPIGFRRIVDAVDTGRGAKAVVDRVRRVSVWARRWGVLARARARSISIYMGVGVGASFRHCRGIRRFLIFQPPRLRLVRLRLAMLSDSFALVRQTTLGQLPIPDPEERVQDRTDTRPLPLGQLCIPGKQPVVVRERPVRRPPHRHQQEEVRAVLDGGQVGRVAEIGVGPERGTSPLGQSSQKRLSARLQRMVVVPTGPMRCLAQMMSIRPRQRSMRSCHRIMASTSSSEGFSRSA